MTSILLLLAVLGMVVGVYAVAMPTLTRKGWRLPFAGFFAEADDGEDVEFVTPFAMPRDSETPAVLASSIAAPAEVPEPLPPVVTIDLAEVEDDPTLLPLFEGLEAEVTAEVTPPAADGAPAEATAPKLVLVHSQPADAVQAPEAAEPTAEEPEPEAPADDSMLALFSEAADAGKAPNKLLESVGDVTILDLQEEVRKLREILNKRAA